MKCGAVCCVLSLRPPCRQYLSSRHFNESQSNSTGFGDHTGDSHHFHRLPLPALLGIIIGSIALTLLALVGWYVYIRRTGRCSPCSSAAPPPAKVIEVELAAATAPSLPNAAASIALPQGASASEVKPTFASAPTAV